MVVWFAVAGKPKDLTGRRFGSWTALALSKRDGHRTWWSVRCDCGNESVVRADSLVSGGSVQCVSCAAGERSRTHGLTKTPTWMSWHAMRTRCLTPTAADYPKYGGRGIGICREWDSYERFLADMGERPRNMTLDRIDPNGDYTPRNCRWATNLQQQRNRRKTVFLEVNGERRSLSEWAELRGFSHIAFYKRYAAGWTDEAIVNTPKQPPNCPKPCGRRTASAVTSSR